MIQCPQTPFPNAPVRCDNRYANIKKPESLYLTLKQAKKILEKGFVYITREKKIIRVECGNKVKAQIRKALQ